MANRCQERLDTQDIHDTGEIKASTCSAISEATRQGLHQEVGCAHPGFDGAEGMLDRLTALTHGLRVLVEPLLHRIKHMLMLPSGDPALFARGAFMLDSAALTDVGPVTAQDKSVFFGRVAIDELLTAGQI